MGAPPTQTESPSPPRRPRRWLRRLALAVLALLLLALGLGWLTLGTAAGRRAVLDRISRSFEASSGMRLGAADFSLRFSPGHLELRDVSLSIEDAPPFLVAERVRVDFEWGGLFGEPTVLESVAVERPVADLRQPLPPPSDEPPPRIDIRALRLTGGRLLGTVEATGGEAPWIGSWSVESVDLGGSYVGDRADLRLEPARLQLVRTVGGPLDLEIASGLAGPLDGPYVLEDLEVQGEGLTLGASGELGTGEEEPLFLRLDLDAEAAFLLAELGLDGRPPESPPGPQGTLQVRGEIDLRRFRGDLAVTARDFPSEALEPWIGEAARPGGQPSRLDLDARFKSDPDALPQVTGEAELLWRQKKKTLVEASVDLLDGRLDANGVVLTSLVGDVRAVARDLPADFLRPWLGADQLDRLAAGGTRLDLEGDFTVDAAHPAAPRGSLKLAWRGAEPLVRASARTVDGGAPAELVVDFDAALLESRPGRRQVAGRLAAPSWPEIAAGELRRTRLDLELPEVAEAVADAAERWPRLFADAGFDPGSLPESLRGPLEVRAELTGPFDAFAVDLDATWRPSPESSLAVRASGEPAARRGRGAVTLDRVDLALLPGAMSGTVSGNVEAEGSPDDWTGSVALDGAGLRYGLEMPAFEELRLEATTDGRSVEIGKVAGRKGDSVFDGDGRMELAEALGAGDGAETTIRRGRLRLAAQKPFSGIDSLDFEAELEAGVVHVTRLDVEAPTGPGDLKADVPLGALRAFEVDVDAWPVEVADGRIKVDLGFPSLDLGKLVTDVGQQPPWTTNAASLTGRVWITPSDLTAAEGELLVEEWLLEVGNHRLEVGDDPILMALADRKLEILPVTLQADGNLMNVEGTVELAPGWTLADGVDKLVAAIQARADGFVDGGLLTPYLEGGVAEGPLAVSAEVSGPLDDLRAHAVLDGPEATVLYIDPYVTQLRNLHAEIDLAGGELTVSNATAGLNGGQLAVDVRRTSAGDWTVDTVVSGARYRLDYGLTAIVDTDLSLSLPAAGKGLLSGNVEVVRAVQRRDLDLDREILNTLFAPPEVTGAGDGGLDDIELDLKLTTSQGVKVKNNIVDVHADWNVLSVQGSLGNPSIDGRIDLDPGGRVYAYGRIARIDQGSLVFTGEPGLPPQIDIQPTWDIDDATVATAGDQLQQLRMTWEPSVKPEPEDTSLNQYLFEGVTGFVGGRLDRRLAGARVRVQPVLVFGETDPSAKLVVSRDISRWIAFAVAVDLRDSQSQTYVLDLHRLRNFPRVVFQLFTEDGAAEGTTVQQTVSLGGRKRQDGRRLRKVSFEGAPEEIRTRSLRRALGFDDAEPITETTDFEAEVETLDFLRRRGYPAARVAVEVVPAGSRDADLSISIVPGPRAIFEFEGTKPPVALRRSITEPYRTDFYEQRSLEEVRQQVVSALRSQGYLEPRVETEVDYRQGVRTVTVSSEGGRKARVDRLVFQGVDAETAILLRSRFETTVARVELAAAVPAADDWLLRNLRSMGYPEASILSRRLAEDGRELAVEIVPGPRRELASVRVEGLSQVEADDYLKRLPVRPGEPPRPDLIVGGNLLIRNDLKSRGYSEAQVRTDLRPVEEGSLALDLVYRVEPGPQYRLDAVRFAGLGTTSPKWARKITELEDEALLDQKDLGAARRRLSATGLFESVRTLTERSPDGLAQVTFEVEEAPRYQLAYGVRWENGEGAAGAEGSSLVVDVLNRNFLGRGMTIGLRGLYGDRDRAARFYANRAGILGRRLAVQFYLQQRHEETRPTQEFVDDSLLIDTTEASAQLAFPLGKLTSQVYARFRREKIRERIPFDPMFPFEEEIRFPFVGWQLIYDRRDDRIAPTRGYLASTDLSVTGDYIASDFDFIRLFTQFQWMNPVFKLGERQFVWAQSYRVGYLTSRDAFPLREELFRAGGERSVRGYPRRSLTDADRGGESLLVVNQELRFPVWEEISGLVFMDFGNAWGDPGDFGSDLFKSVGLGVRAATPVGLLRVDFAYPLDRRLDDPSHKIYFGLGHAF